MFDFNFSVFPKMSEHSELNGKYNTFIIIIIITKYNFC